MTEGPYAFFDVYVAVADPETIVERLRTALGGTEVPTTARHDLILGPLRITGDHNGCRTWDRADPDDFLPWPTVLEGETSPGAAPAEVVEAVATLLRTLWGMGYRALAACDFEHELPDAGGAARYR
ncbi:hypothetical protein HHL19_17130 [Streptomyces sp. R302]|uniref:hypothetical protein n=1 Tax=unclassified Streptomyces TaxID=2593676 RepID=UPI00145F501A|nr:MULTISPECIES: hypothetical protein [unclassified Streptomyces]NML52712.1 hypothetical protein [Streptomyces sp. R301]NML80359.1 hypothetical protein [Streptomyces sp. R302]